MIFKVTYGLSQLLIQPTHSSNALDLLFVNNPLLLFDVTIQSPFSTSDHNALSWRTWSLFSSPSLPIFKFQSQKAN